MSIPRYFVKSMVSTLALLAFLSGLCLADDAAPKAGGLQGIINAAIKANQSELKIKPGTYRLSEMLVITEAENMTIDGTGVNLVFTKSDMRGVLVAECKNLTLKGFNIDYDPLPFVQGAVTRIKPDKGYIEVTLHEGYPDLTPAYLKKHTCHIFDKTTREWKQNGFNSMASRVKILTPRKARVFLKPVAMYLVDKVAPVVQMGDLAIINTRGIAGVTLNECENLTVDGLTVNTCPGICFLGVGCSGTLTFRNVKLVPGAKPKGATEERLISTCADAINVSGLRGKLVVENCELSRMADDGINLCGVGGQVLKVLDDKTFLAAIRGKKHKDMYQGDPLSFYSLEDMSPIGYAKLAAFESLKMKDKEAKQFIEDSGVKLLTKKPDFSVVKITLDTPVAVKRGTNINFDAFDQAGAVIRGNNFHNHRARSIRMQVSNVLIENNRFDNVMNAAITLGAEGHTKKLSPFTSAWFENVTIRNNTIKNVGRGKAIAMPWCSAAGAICIELKKFREIKPTYPGFKNIVIEDNTISGCSVAAIHTCAVKGLSIKNNKISKVNLIDGKDVSMELGMPSDHAVTVYCSPDAVIEGNTFSDLGKFCQGDVLNSPTLKPIREYNPQAAKNEP